MGTATVSGRDFLQIRDAARLLKVSEQTLRNWDRLGHLRAHRHPINGYRLYRVGDLHAVLDRLHDLPNTTPGQLSLLESESVPLQDEGDVLPPCHWDRKVALDPKHRPQKWSASSGTVRRDWRKFPQEAHVLDSTEAKYRRFTVDEIAILQGFSPSVFDVTTLTQRERIACIGDAVPPPLARSLLRGICEVYRFANRTAIEICAGSGGLAEGAVAADLEPLLLVDAAPACGEILRNRRAWPEEAVVVGDIRAIDFSAYRGRVGLLSGGPPCQPWSLSGTRGGTADVRDLLGYTPELVGALLPEVFLFENVPGLAMFNDGSYLEQLVQELRAPAQGTRYGVLVAVLNAADFGVPQTRQRVFILGLKEQRTVTVSKCFDAVAARRTHQNPARGGRDLPPWVTVGDALEGRPDPGGWRRWIGGALVD